MLNFNVCNTFNVCCHDKTALYKKTQVKKTYISIYIIVIYSYLSMKFIFKNYKNL